MSTTAKKTTSKMKFSDLTLAAQAKVKSNFWAAKEVLTDYVFHKSVVKITAIFVRYGEEIIIEFTFNKSGALLNETIESRRFL